jgi:hypothetical protein
LDNAKPPHIQPSENATWGSVYVPLWDMEMRSGKLIAGKLSLAEDARGLLALGRVTWFDRRNSLQLVSARFFCGET